MPPIASLSSQEPLVGTQTHVTGSKLWPYLITALSTILLCLFGLYGVWMFQGQRARRFSRRGSDVELGSAATAGIRIVRTAPSVASRPARAPVRPRADAQPPTAAGGATRRFRIPGWPPRSRVEAQAFLRRRAGRPRFPPDTFPVADSGGESSNGTTAGVRQRRRRRLAVTSSRE